MRNTDFLSANALSVRRAMLGKQASVAEALLPFTPMGWCGGVQKPGEEAKYFWGGEAQQGKTPVERDTIFRVASVSKVIGGAAAMKLVQQGKLSLDAPVSDVLGIDTFRPITMRQLLTHTAALDDSIAYDDAIEQSELPPLAQVLEKSYLPYEPGTRFLYSNFGAGIVGMMIEAVTGMIFDDYVRQRFFDPYGIDASFHPQRIVHKERMANCYNVPGNKLSYDAQKIATLPMDDKPNPLRHYQMPAGKLMIATPDLLSTLQRIAKEVPEMFVEQDSIGSVKFNVGRGLGVAIAHKGIFRKGRTLWGHQGSAYGAMSQAWIDLEDGTTAVLETNGVRQSGVLPLSLAGQNGIMALLDQ